MLLKEFKKAPDAVLDFSIDWGTWLNDSDAVSTATWSVESDAGDTDPILVDSDSLASNKATAILSGGTEKTYYRVKCVVTTTGGLTEEAYLMIEVI